MDKAVLLQCNQLCKHYHEGGVKTDVLHNINFTMRNSEMIAIIGSSGSGKSTLLNLLGGLDTPTSGEVLFSGYSLNNMNSSKKAELRNRKVGFIYQFHHLLPDFTALENVAMPLLIGKKNRKEAFEKAITMLNTVGLIKRSSHYPAELSGGERQRVAIARALVTSPRLVLADEPTGNLDEQNTNAIFDLLCELNVCQGTAFLVVTHDLYLANRLPLQYEMRNGYLYNTINVTTL